MCLKCIPTNNLSDDYLNGLPPIFTQAMQDLYSGKIQPADLHGDLVRAIAAELWQGVGIGFNTDFNILDVDSQQYRLAKSFQENIYVFSGFKTYHELKEASLMMVDELGKQKPFTQFMQDVQKVNKTYNVTYLRNEYDNATVSGQMANKWLDFSEDGLLKFIATIDDHTTEICFKLNGLIKPKNWSGWKKYYLPLHWGERSNIIEVADGDISQVHESDLDDPKPMFNGNIAIDGVIFPDTHPYFNAPKKDIGKIVKQSLTALKNQVFSLPIEKQFNVLKTFENKGSVSEHKLVNSKSPDYSDVTTIASYYAEQGNKVQILPEIHSKEPKARELIMPMAKGNTSADLLINGKILIEVEKTANFKNLENRISSGYKQANYVALIYDKDIENISFDKTINTLFRVHENLQQVDIFNSKHKLIYSKIKKGAAK